MKHNVYWMRVGLMFLVSGMGMAQADGVLSPAHGGKMVENQGQRLELTVQEKTVDLYLTGHDNQPATTEGTSGKVLFLVGGKKVETVLKAAGENRLHGEAQEAVADFASAVISVEMNGKHISARLSANH